MSESLPNELVGRRIRLLDMPDDPCPVPAGTTGTVRRVIDFPGPGGKKQIDVDWDVKRSLMLITPPDRFVVIG